MNSQNYCYCCHGDIKMAASLWKKVQKCNEQSVIYIAPNGSIFRTSGQTKQFFRVMNGILCGLDDFIKELEKLPVTRVESERQLDEIHLDTIRKNQPRFHPVEKVGEEKSCRDSLSDEVEMVSPYFRQKKEPESDDLKTNGISFSFDDSYVVDEENDNLFHDVEIPFKKGPNNEDSLISTPANARLLKGSSSDIPDTPFKAVDSTGASDSLPLVDSVSTNLNECTQSMENVCERSLDANTSSLRSTSENHEEDIVSGDVLAVEETENSTAPDVSTQEDSVSPYFFKQPACSIPGVSSAQPRVILNRMVYCMASGKKFIPCGRNTSLVRKNINVEKIKSSNDTLIKDNEKRTVRSEMNRDSDVPVLNSEKSPLLHNSQRLLKMLSVVIEPLDLPANLSVENQGTIINPADTTENSLEMNEDHIVDKSFEDSPDKHFEDSLDEHFEDSPDEHFEDSPSFRFEDSPRNRLISDNEMSENMDQSALKEIHRKYPLPRKTSSESRKHRFRNLLSSSLDHLSHATEHRLKKSFENQELTCIELEDNESQKSRRKSEQFDSNNGDTVTQDLLNLEVKLELVDVSINENEYDVPMTPKTENRSKKTHVRTSPYFNSQATNVEKVKNRQRPKKMKSTKSKGPRGLHETIDYHPPKSPHSLIQEELYNKPWQLLLATIFLNKTTGAAAIPLFWKFIKKYDSPLKVLKTEHQNIAEFMRPLGLNDRRAKNIIQFSDDFINKPWKYPIDLYGIGKYGNDSYRIFCLGQWKDVKPNDHKLNLYHEWISEQNKNSLLT